jgi:hypothetical protein
LTASCTDEDTTDGSYGFGPDDIAFVHELLAPVEVWPRSDVDASLGLGGQ